MATNTTNLNLYKKDPLTDGNDYFDVNTMLNDNWDKIDNEMVKRATQSQDGRMSKEDKIKIDGVESEANKYIHPSSHTATMIIEDSNHKFVTDVEKGIWNSKLDASLYTPNDVLNKIKTVDGSGSGLDGDTLDGRHGYEYGYRFTKDFTVDGDADTYYPVVIKGSITNYNNHAQTRIEIFRRYSWDAPDTWYTSTHKGGLQVIIDLYASGWGGQVYYVNTLVGQTYSKIIADMKIVPPDTKTLVVWLRGGGADYRIMSDAVNLNIDTYLGDFLYQPGVDPMYDRTYSPRTDVIPELNYTGIAKKFVNVPELYIGGSYSGNPFAGGKVWTDNNCWTIVEKGSNTNGEYIRFSDGTQICYKEGFKLPYYSSVELRDYWVFPAAFSRSPSVTFNPEYSTRSGMANSDITSQYAYGTSGSNRLLVVFSANNGFNSSDYVYAHAMAIGRWK